MRILALLRTASPTANFLAASSTVALLLKVLVLDQLPEMFPGAHKAGLLSDAILTSVVASYVFYLLVVHVKEQTDKDTLRPYIQKHATRVVGDCLSQLSEISKTTGSALSLDSVEKEDVLAAFAKIQPYSPAPLIISPSNARANWFEYFSYHEVRTKGSIRKLLDQLVFLDSRLVATITAIDDCSHFTHLSLVRESRVSNADLSVWAPPFWDYCVLCRALNSYLSAPGRNLPAS